VCVALSGEREVYGLLCVRDERLRDAFSPEEVQLLVGLGNQIVTAIENSPNVRIDPERLRQVLINLVQNALEAIESGGTLRIETETREAPDLDGQTRSWVEIRVTDTGPGIPQQVLANLFEPFVTTRQKGTGLGLAISQRIVHAAGGRIVVRTRENHGSTFTVRLPVASSDGEPRQLPSSTQSERPPDATAAARDVPSGSTTNR
jgi:signal transduction histidine kinase